MIEIRKAEARDRPAVLEIARELVNAADTYAYDPDISDEALWEYWAPPAPGQGFVASIEGAVRGCFVIRPNHPGPASHIANASYAVHSAARGQGLGRQLGEASLVEAKAAGYRAMQFNIVISTNTAAVKLWKSLGFEVIGTVPEGFSLPDGRLVDHLIMYRRLD